MKLYIVTMKTGTDFFKELVFADNFDDAKETAELRFDDAKCVNIRRKLNNSGGESPLPPR